MKKNVYITRKLPMAGINMLKKKFNVEIFPESKPMPEKLLEKKIEHCHALVSLLSDKIGERLLSRAKNLMVVANYAVGYNNIDVSAAKKRGILVTNTPGVLTNATAEIAFSLMVTLTRKILSADRFTREGRFIGWDPLLFLGDELRGKTVGIIGMGRIGADMAAKCKAFGMNVIYHNRKPLEETEEKRLSAKWVSLKDLLKRSHVISIHAPLTPATRHMIDKDALKAVRPDAYIINTARGEIIDEKALAMALKEGRIRGAGLDVYEFEPEITEELLALDSVVLLPHIGSATLETREKMSELAALSVIDALEGRIPKHLVPELK